MQAPSKEELMRAVAEHLVRAHHIDSPTRTVLNYLQTKIRADPQRPPWSPGKPAPGPV